MLENYLLNPRLVDEISPNSRRGVTFNIAAVYLPRSAENDPIIARLLDADALADPALRDGVVAAHYRALPLHNPGFRWTRSFTGLTVFTPDTARLLKRWDEPVITPGEDPGDADYLGVEDPRVTRSDTCYYVDYYGMSARER